MIHRPIQIKDLELSFPHKTCFEHFNIQIPYGSRIALIGKNGSGKSTLLKMIVEISKKDAVVGYVPQEIEDHTHLSGGERFNNALSEALSIDPNILLLDEPTNHLDHNNRKSLMRMLQHYPGTLIVASHDPELLRNNVDTLWHIDQGAIFIFSGNYDDYMREMSIKRSTLEKELTFLNLQKKETHNKLMQEQERISKSKASGEKKIENRKWSKMVGDLKSMKAEKSQGKKMTSIDEKREDLSNKLANLRLPEIIIPKFSISNNETGSRTLIQITEGKIGYVEHQPLLSNIHLLVDGQSRIAIRGNNGSGKSTLIKAIMGDAHIYKEGNWFLPKSHDVGYLDQQYSTLKPRQTVFETISELTPLSHGEIRRHLNDFLFRKNEEVNALVETLSGGEKARLSLAQIAAKTPKILILDEITNNLDLDTRMHVIQVLKAYPGAMIVISHDADFLKEIEIDTYCEIKDGYFQ